MEIISNPQIRREILETLRFRYLESTKESRAPGIHLTQLVYCLTRSFYNVIKPLPPNDMEIMLFSLGFGLENILLRENSRVKAGEKDGIHYSPDFIPLSGGLAELKTTRASEGKLFPETWLEQILGYMYAERLEYYDLVVLHLLGNYKPPFPSIVGYRITPTADELVRNWDRLTMRRDVLVKAFVAGEAPAPGKWCKDWEPKYCRYGFKCSPKCKGGN